MSAIDLFLARINKEEGERMLPYDDATGRNVYAPKGNLSWGRGYNLMQCGSKGLFDVMDRYLVGLLDAQLRKFSWYVNAGEVRASVFLDIAYNDGLHGLLGFHRMITAAADGDWKTASQQCAVVNEQLNQSRYAPLRALLLAGG